MGELGELGEFIELVEFVEFIELGEFVGDELGWKFVECCERDT